MKILKSLPAKLGEHCHHKAGIMSFCYLVLVNFKSFITAWKYTFAWFFDYFSMLKTLVLILILLGIRLSVA